MIIYSKTGSTRYDAPITQDAVHVRELMKEHYVQLSFNAPLIEFSIGDYIIHEQEKFTLRELPKPERAGSFWNYTIQFDSFEAGFKNCVMFFIPETGAKESEWTLTSKPTDFMSMAVKNINRFFGTTIQLGTVLSAETKSITFTNVSVWDALSQIAETFDTEWYFDGTYLHLNKYEYGSGVLLDLDRQVKSISGTKGDQNGYATRIYPYGSTRNIIPETTSSATDSILNNRLKLSGAEYIDSRADLTKEEIVEAVVIFEDIYPRMKDKAISSVRFKEETIDDTKQNVYYFKIANLGFDPKPLILEGMNLSVKFESGNLNGREFELNWHSDTEEFEILNVSESGSLIIPNASLCPAVGDTVVLFNLQMPDSYKTEAQTELLTAAQEYIAESSKDRTVYTCETNPVFCSNEGIDLNIGQRVRLADTTGKGTVNLLPYALPVKLGSKSNYRDSRIQRFEKKLYNKYICSYQVGDNAEYSRLNNIEREAREAKYAVTGNIQTGGSSIPVITKYDSTKPTDANVYSALRSREDFAKRKENDTITGRHTYSNGLSAKDVEIIELIKSSGVFNPSFAGSGFGISKDASTGEWTGVLDNLIVRRMMTVFEMVISKIRAINGDILVTQANGKIRNITSDSTYYYLTFEDSAFVINDLLRCKTALKEYWVKATLVTEDVVKVSKSDIGWYSSVPEIGDEVIQCGNTVASSGRNSAVYVATNDNKPRVEILTGITSRTLVGSCAGVYGVLDGIADTDFASANNPTGSLSGVGLYIPKIYAKGEFCFISGQKIEDLINEADAKAQAAAEAAAAAGEAATAAQQSANSALGTLSEISADDKLTNDEKIVVRKELAIIQSEYLINKAKGEAYGVSVDAYVSSYSALNNYIVNKISSTTTTTIVRADFNNAFKIYYDARTNLLNSIYDVCKTIADEANNSAGSVLADLNAYKGIVNNKIANLETLTSDLQDQIDGNVAMWNGEEVPSLTNYPVNTWTQAEYERHVGDVYNRTYSNNGVVTTESYKFAYYNSVYQWVLVTDSQAAEAYQKAQEALGLAGSKSACSFGATPNLPCHVNDLWVYYKANDSNSGTIYICNANNTVYVASNWQVVNDAALRLNNLANDNIITKEEKVQLRDTWTQIQKEYIGYAADATKYNVSIATLLAKYNAISTFLTNTIKINEVSDVTLTAANKTTYNTVFSDYYMERTRFANIIATALAANVESNLNDYIDGELSAVQSQLDKKAETWYQDTDPSISWATDALKAEHEGDIWYNTSSFTVSGVGSGATAIYKSKVWVSTPLPTYLFDEIDGKSSVYTSKPTSYNIRDMWIVESNSVISGYKTGDMLTATASSASFNASHWTKKVRYTDDEAVNNLVIGGVNIITNLKENYEQGAYSNGSGIKIDTDKYVRVKEFVKIKPNTTYTVTLAEGFGADIHERKQDGTFILHRQSGNKLTFKTGVTTERISVNVYKIAMGVMALDDVLLFKIKIEEGTKSTLWSQCPDDIDKRVENIITEFSAKDGRIAALIKEISPTKEEIARTGFDIKTGRIDTYADKFYIMDSSGNPVAAFEMINGKPRFRTDLINADTLVSKRVKSGVSGARVEIEGAMMRVFGDFGLNIELGVNDRGYAVLTYYDNSGQKLYDLGPSGFDWGSIKPASWSQIRLTFFAASKADGSNPDFDIMLKTGITNTTGTVFYQYYAGSNPTLPDSEKAKEAYLYTSQSTSGGKISDGWYCISTSTPMMHPSNETGEIIQPEPNAVYEYLMGVYDIAPIYFRSLIEYKNGKVNKRINAYWNGKMLY